MTIVDSENLVFESLGRTGSSMFCEDKDELHTLRPGSGPLSISKEKKQKSIIFYQLVFWLVKSLCPSVCQCVRHSIQWLAFLRGCPSHLIFLQGWWQQWPQRQAQRWPQGYFSSFFYFIFFLLLVLLSAHLEDEWSPVCGTFTNIVVLFTSSHSTLHCTTPTPAVAPLSSVSCPMLAPVLPNADWLAG